MLNILKNGYNKSKSLKDKETYLQSLSSYRQFKTTDLEEKTFILTKIKQCLEDDDSRLEGLILLRTFLDQCTDEVFSANVLLWTKFLLAVLKSEDGKTNKVMACDILELIVVKVVQFPDLKKEFLNTQAPLLVQLFLQMSPLDEWVVAMVSCLSVCLRDVPSVCVPHRDEIEDLLMTIVDSVIFMDDEPIVNCFVNLGHVGAKGPTNMNNDPAKRWTEHLFKLLIGLNEYINSVYEPYIDYCSGRDIGLPPDLLATERIPFVTGYPQDRLMVFCIAHRIDVLFQSLSKLISAQSKLVIFPVSSIFPIIQRALEVSMPQLVSNGNVWGFELLAVLPKIHCSALLVVQALVSSSHCHLRWEESILWKILSRCLTRDQCDRNLARHHDYDNSLVRASVYRTFKMCFEKFVSLTFQIYAKAFFAELLLDIQISDQRTIPSGSNSSQSNQQSFQQSVAKSATTNSIVCAEALSALSSLLCCIKNCSVMSQNQIERLQQIVANLLITVQQQQKHFNVASPYEDPECRLELYRVLFNLLLYGPCMNLLRLAHHMFCVGQKDPNCKVSSLCHQGSALCFSVIAPDRIIPSLHIHKGLVFDLPVPQEEDEKVGRQQLPELIGERVGSTEQDFEQDVSQHSSTAMSNSYVGGSLTDRMPNFSALSGSTKLNGHDRNSVDMESGDDCMVEEERRPGSDRKSKSKRTLGMRKFPEIDDNMDDEDEDEGEEEDEERGGYDDQDEEEDEEEIDDDEDEEEVESDSEDQAIEEDLRNARYDRKRRGSSSSDDGEESERSEEGYDLPPAKDEVSDLEIFAPRTLVHNDINFENSKEEVIDSEKENWKDESLKNTVLNENGIKSNSPDALRGSPEGFHPSAIKRARFSVSEENSMGDGPQIAAVTNSKMESTEHQEVASDLVSQMLGDFDEYSPDDSAS